MHSTDFRQRVPDLAGPGAHSLKRNGYGTGYDARFIQRAPAPGGSALKAARDTVCRPQRLLEDPGIMLAGWLGDDD
ncbi:MAG: hypothetical protein HGA93_06315 [Methanothrix sp.]|nr:hypothetical protein [Methanothrix sp.]